MPSFLSDARAPRNKLLVTARELDSGWVSACGHMRRGWLPGVGIPGLACESSALNGEVPVVSARVDRDTVCKWKKGRGWTVM